MDQGARKPYSQCLACVFEKIGPLLKDLGLNIFGGLGVFPCRPPTSEVKEIMNFNLFLKRLLSFESTELGSVCVHQETEVNQLLEEAAGVFLTF